MSTNSNVYEKTKKYLQFPADRWMCQNQSWIDWVNVNLN